MKKKHYGQHFLKNPQHAQMAAAELKGWGSEYELLIEVGPGEGMLTEALLERRGDAQKLKLVEVDGDLIPTLQKRFATQGVEVVHADFLQAQLGHENFGLVGNFPYNISSQIVFKMLDLRAQIPEMVGMFQKEVAQRIVAAPGSKVYGILSVLAGAYYQRAMCFSLKPGAFHPPPKVDSSVIRLHRERSSIAALDERMLFTLVKAAFGQRRKTLRNSLKPWLTPEKRESLDANLLQLRPEQLSVDTFVQLSKALQK